MNAPANRPQLGDIRTMPIGEIAALPAAVLALLQEEAEEAAKAARSLADWLNGAIALRYGDRAAAARRAEGKDTGTVRFDDDEVTVIADLPKKVDWDQAELGSMVARIRAAGDDPGRVRRDDLPGLGAEVRRLAGGDPRRLRGGAHGEARQADLPPRARGGALMALRIITADERLAEANLKTTAAIFGPSGVGKTTLLKTLPEATTLCLDLEAGLKSVQDWRGDSIPIRTFEDAARHRLPDRRHQPGGGRERLLLRGALPASRRRPSRPGRADRSKRIDLRRLDHRPDPAGDGLGEDPAGGLLREDRQARHPRRLRAARPRGDRAPEAPAARRRARR